MLPPEEVPQIGAAIGDLLAERSAYGERMRALSRKHIYDSGRTNQIGAEHILGILDGGESTPDGRALVFEVAVDGTR